MGMLSAAIRGWAKVAMKGFHRFGSSHPGHPFRFTIALVYTAPMPLSALPMLPMLPRIIQTCENMISMVLADIYGSIPEGFS